MLSEGTMQVSQGVNQPTVISSYDAGESQQWLACCVNLKGNINGMHSVAETKKIGYEDHSTRRKSFLMMETLPTALG